MCLQPSPPESKQETGVRGLGTTALWSQEGQGEKASRRQSSAATSPGSASHRETIASALTETKRRMLGAADPQGSEGAVERTGEPPSFTACCPCPSGPAFPGQMPQPRFSLQGRLSHKLVFQALGSMAAGGQHALSQLSPLS